jgi:hypothetical protein
MNWRVGWRRRRPRCYAHPRFGKVFRAADGWYAHGARFNRRENTLTGETWQTGPFETMRQACAFAERAWTAAGERQGATV